MNVAVEMDDVRQGKLLDIVRRVRHTKRIIAGFGFWSSCERHRDVLGVICGLRRARQSNCRRSTGFHLFNIQSTAMETAFLLLSSYSCGLMWLHRAIRGNACGFSSAPWLRSCWARHFSNLKLREFHRHDRGGGGPATHFTSFRLLHAGRMSRAACGDRTGLAASRDGSAVDFWIPSGLWCAVLHCFSLFCYLLPFFFFFFFFFFIKKK